MSRVRNPVLAIGLLAMMAALVWLNVENVSAKGPAGIQHEGVNWHPQSGSGAVEGARAKLVRTDKGVNASFHARELNPGHVYTLWFIVINNHEACAADPCTAGDILFSTELVQADVTYGGGFVAGGSGKGTLSGHLAVGELDNAWFGAIVLNTILLVFAFLLPKKLLTPMGYLHAWGLGVLVWGSLHAAGYIVVMFYFLRGSAVTRIRG